MKIIRFKQALACSAAVMVLWGCGGEDGPAPAPVATATPTPSPTPTPTPSPTPGSAFLPPAPFGLTASTNFALTGYQHLSAENLPPVFVSAEDKGALAWSADLKTYTLALTDLGSGRLLYTFPNNNPHEFSLFREDGTKVDVSVTVILRTAAIGELYWQSLDGKQPFIYARSLFGIAPAAGSLPETGRRIFVTDTSPETAIRFDFATRQVSGTLTVIYDNGWDPAGPKEIATLEPAVFQTDGSFTAKINVAGAASPGELRGRLMGKDGNELAVYWNAPARSGYPDSTFEAYQTVMHYPVCGTCPG